MKMLHNPQNLIIKIQEKEYGTNWPILNNIFTKLLKFTQKKTHTAAKRHFSEDAQVKNSINSPILLNIYK